MLLEYLNYSSICESIFQTKGLGSLNYFLCIEVAHSNDIVISQRKYALHILKEICMIDCRPLDSPMDLDQKLMIDPGEYFFDSKT